jgi:hypothetical protein
VETAIEDLTNKKTTEDDAVSVDVLKVMGGEIVSEYSRSWSTTFAKLEIVPRIKRNLQWLF